MVKKFLVGVITAVALTASAASAATLSLHGTGYQSHTVTNNDVLGGLNNTSITMIDGAAKSPSNGLFLDIVGSAARVTYTYLGFEAWNSNFANIGPDDAGFDNKGPMKTTVGTQVTVTQAVSGFLDFAFGTYSPYYAKSVFNNDGGTEWLRKGQWVPGTSNFAIGFAEIIGENAFYVLFDDIARGDRDFDDMVMRIDVAAVPLPAGSLLLLSALGGALVLRRRKTIAA